MEEDKITRMERLQIDPQHRMPRRLWGQAIATGIIARSRDIIGGGLESRGQKEEKKKEQYIEFTHEL